MLNSQVDEIKNKLDIVETLSGYIKLQKAGVNFRALCPFHNEKTPSFTVSPARQIWHCFGCSQGGDIFSFVMKIENVEFPEALKMLAERAGVALKRENPQLRSEKNRLSDVLEAATKFFEANLEKTATGQKAKEYLLGRGLKEEITREFRLGFASDSWDSLLRFLTSRGFKGPEIEKAGLIVKSEKSDRQYYDRFRSRIMFPIFNLSGQIAGFSGRIFTRQNSPLVNLSGQDGQDEARQNPSANDLSGQAKYVNTPATLLYDKSRILYGLDKSKNQIREKE
ncbi:MAG: CHC2 zinc finger domain-containing protein, partial [bacterium]|nr:CHC2 zinc finger domain-containing protein [bacterium]